MNEERNHPSTEEGGHAACEGCSYGEVKCQNEIHIRIGLKTRLPQNEIHKNRSEDPTDAFVDFLRVAVGRVRVPAEGMPGGQLYL